MSAPSSAPLVQVPVQALDASWVGEQLLVTTRTSQPATYCGALSDIAAGPPIVQGCLPDGRMVVAPSWVLFIGGETVLITPGDVILAAAPPPPPRALAVEHDPAVDGGDLAGSPYDT